MPCFSLNWQPDAKHPLLCQNAPRPKGENFQAFIFFWRDDKVRLLILHPNLNNPTIFMKILKLAEKFSLNNRVNFLSHLKTKKRIEALNSSITQKLRLPTLILDH
jgi:hypothetical protein